MILSLAATVGALSCLPVEKLPGTMLSLARIIVLVLAICFITSILEYRCWLHRISLLALPLIRFGRLPGVSGHAMISSFASGSVASMMLVEAHKEQKITRREMILSGLCTSVPPVFMFSSYLMLPVIGIIGSVGVIYFAINSMIHLTALCIFLLCARFFMKKYQVEEMDRTSAVPLSWLETMRKSRKMCLAFLSRLLVLTMPFYLWTACAVSKNWLTFTLPDSMQSFMSPGAIAVFGARIGGLLAASGTAAELMKQHQITTVQLLTALLAGNILNAFIRLIRRGIPVALGIYPGYDGMLIASVSVGTRLLLIFVAIMILWSVMI